MLQPSDVIDFWFGTDPLSAKSIAARHALWFANNADFDREVRARFEGLLHLAQSGTLREWEESPEGLLALVILQDQFPRNIYRGEAKAFHHDAAALALSLRAISCGWDLRLNLIERVFLYLPLEHAEDIEMQALCVRKFTELATECPNDELQQTFLGFVKYAELHRDIIERFGRFPHRNAVLARTSTEEELQYLKSGGATFGQTK